MTTGEPLTFELCAETLAACAAANAGGAHRIELCSQLDIGGMTPDPDLIAAAVRLSSIPVHVLLRPVADSFRSSPSVVAALESSLHTTRRLGVAGVVLGLLRQDGTVDVDATRSLVRQAAPLPVTFHRAFDATPDLFQALEDVISTGCTRILTSGGAVDVLTGAPTLARLVRLAGDRIDVAIGGGLRADNAETVARLTGGRHFHGSLQRDTATGGKDEPTPERVRHMVDLLASSSRR